MANHYQVQRQVFREIENLIKKTKDGCDKRLLIYELTMKYSVSEKAIVKRLSLMENLDLIDIIDNIIKWKKHSTK